MRVRFLNFLAALSLLGVSASHAAESVKIGTGGPTGVYFATGHVLCDLLKVRDIECAVPPSGGSVFNLNALKAGEIEFAMAQSDWQFHAYHGSSKWEGTKIENLRAIFSVYAEPVQVVVNRDAKIPNWFALQGHSINIGNPGSGHRETMEEMLETQHLKLSAFAAISEMASSQQVDAFCDGKFDAFVYAVGIPNDAIKRAVAECNGELIEPHRTIIRKLATAARPYYSKVKIPAKTYWDGQKKVDTFGVMATLVTLAETDSVLVDTLVRAVFEDFAGFKARHPAYEVATPEKMVKEGVSAPLHDAAKTYYESKGWIR